jgi:L-cysteate sulfo-lyase
LADGADTVVTTGAPQSNHARLTAAAASRLGLDAVLVFPGEPATELLGNLLLDGIHAATIVWTGPGPHGEEALRAAADDTVARLRHQGRHPLIIPFGGSNAVGAHGYRLAGEELHEQRPDVDHVVCAVGSGGTMAGLVAALGARRVLGVDTGAVADPRATVTGLLSDMGATTVADDLRIRDDQVGTG